MSVCTDTTTEVPILLDTRTIRTVLDALGTIALFTTIALAMSVHDAVTVTTAIGILVITGRAVRYCSATSDSPRRG
ncbi:hypothetical protein QMK17_20190 [Rhodococcus sp. G-MC3]|uniref:hypothetical protein n=1 Tax=Rhodococcus sp. G-MC3 TaxID=3046209 RepID=UPI0024B8E749|nr:hypothetical protein [Rhodococcus sp. G-MC3]MDJ0395645.1 hypothetical protein [Rhodococcus sp. G-MC3]